MRIEASDRVQTIDFGDPGLQFVLLVERPPIGPFESCPEVMCFELLSGYYAQQLEKNGGRDFIGDRVRLSGGGRTIHEKGADEPLVIGQAVWSTRESRGIPQEIGRLVGFRLATASS